MLRDCHSEAPQATKNLASPLKCAQRDPSFRNNERKHHTPKGKVPILRRHLVEEVPVSTLCDVHQLHPIIFYWWLKQFFDNGAAAFGPTLRGDKQVEDREQRIAFP